MNGFVPSTCPELDILENKLYLNYSCVPVSDVKLKLQEFSNFWNSIGRIPLLNASKEDSEELVCLLLNLKRNLKYTLSEIGKCQSKKGHDFVCKECNQNIHISHEGNYWDSIQSHQHLEETLHKFESGSLLLQNSPQSSSKPTPAFEMSKSENNQNNLENGYNGIENSERVANGNSSFKDEGVNSFRFNFKVTYDMSVENRIYPESIMRSVHKMDQVESHTIQKTGPSRAVCHICCCDIISRNKVHKMVIMDHVAGQRHLKNSKSPTAVGAVLKYHELFLGLDVEYQAHQVYFVIEGIDLLRCTLCREKVHTSNVVNHIMSQPHTRFVLDLFRCKNKDYYLINIQVKLYGVQENVVEKAPTENNVPTKEKTPKKSIEKKRKDGNNDMSIDLENPRHHIVKSVNDPHNSDIMELIPHRFKDHKKLLSETETTILCHSCKQHFEKNLTAIRKHLLTKYHEKMSKIPVPKCNFFCEICNMTFTDENTWTKHFTGPNKHMSLGQSRIKAITEYECLSCRLVIFGDEISLIRHRDPIKLKREKEKREIKLPESVKKMFLSPTVVANLGESLAKEAKHMSNNNHKTMECCRQLEVTLNSVFEGCQAHPFGSRMSGLGNKLSDLDVFIDTGDMFNGDKNQDPYNQVQIVRKAANVLGRNKHLFQDVLQIPTARTPIVKLFHDQTQIHCDLSFRHGLSVENTKYLRFCIDLQPITQPFILLLKNWSANNNLSEYITTYALAVMAIFFLQVNDYLLPVKKIRELNSSEAQVIYGWETVNYKLPIEIMRNHVNVYEHSIDRLLRDFFQYYANFPYRDDVVCPLLGYTIKKSLFNDSGSRLPPEMRTYVQQLKSNDAEEFRSLSYFCIQDPFDLSHNLTKACQPNIVNKFKTLCQISAKHLSSDVFSN